MISSLEVGSVFRIEDLASPALKAITDQLALLNKEAESAKKLLTSISRTAFQGLDTRIGDVTKSVAGLGDAGAKAAEKMASSFDAATVTMTASLTKVARQLEEMGVAGAAVGGGGGLVGLRARGGGGHGGGPHIRAPGVPLGGGFHGGLGGPVGIGAGILGFGVFEEMELEDKIATIFQTGGIAQKGPMKDDPRYQKIREQILSAYKMTGMPLHDIEEAVVQGTRLLSPLPMDQRLSTIGNVLTEAMVEGKLKEGTTVEEAMKAMVSLAHQGGKYGPEQIAEMAKHFAYLSTTTDASLPSTMRAAGYAVPILRIADFDQGQLLSMITAMQRAGIVNTKSGTWLDSLFERSFPGTSVMSRIAFEKHESALKTLGLVDANDKQTFLGPDGKPDVFKYMEILGEHVHNMPKNEMMGVFKQLFGQQGERAAAFFSDATNQSLIKQAREDEKNFQSGEAMWTWQRANNPMTQMRTVWADFNTELIELGQDILPPVVVGMRMLDQALKGIKEIFSLPSNVSVHADGGAYWQHVKDAVGGLFGYGSPSYSSGAIAPRGRLTTLSGNAGVGGWWTQDRMQHLADRLVAEAGLSPMGAAALVARWASVEASGGPTSSNNIGGGHWGIAQWDSARGGPAMASASYDDQITHAVGELNGSERAAGDALRSAKTLAEGAIGASRYERAEHYNNATGIDDSTANTPVGSVYRKLFGGGLADAAAKPPVPGVKGAGPWSRVGDDTVFNSDSTDPSIHAHSKVLHVTLNSVTHLDGKVLARNTAKHLVRANMYPRGPGFPDFSALPQGVDSGMASSVSA